MTATVSWSEVTDTSAALRRLGLEDVGGVIVVLAGTQELDSRLADELHEVFERGLRPVLARGGLLVVDGGTDVGVLRVLHESLAGAPVRLLGVAPEAKVLAAGDPPAEGKQEPAAGHTHQFLTSGTVFGDETKDLIALAAAAASSSGAPVVALLVNGGEGARSELDLVLRRRWPVLVLGDSERTAQEVAALAAPVGLWELTRSALRSLGGLLAHWAEPLAPHALGRHRRRSLVRRVERADVVVHRLDAPSARLGQELAWRLEADSVLKRAWVEHAAYDAAATVRQRRYRALLRATLSLSVATTALVLLGLYLPEHGLAGGIVHWTLVVVPAAGALASASLTRLGQDREWVALRSAAEAVKREIYRYRGGLYDSVVGSDPLQQSLLLSVRLDAAEAVLMERQIEVAALSTPEGLPRSVHDVPPDGLTALDATRYVAVRLDDQLSYYARRGAALHRDLVRWILLLPILAFAGTLVAAAGQDVYVVLTASLVTAVGAWFQGQAIRETLGQYSRATRALRRTRRDWLAHQQAGNPLPLSHLVSETETALEQEHAGWVGSLEAAIDQARLPEAAR